MKKKSFRCGRCDTIFPTMNALKKHGKKHVDSLKELRLLRQGHRPVETKMGGEFKGKNKVIIS